MQTPNFSNTADADDPLVHVTNFITSALNNDPSVTSDVFRTFFQTVNYSGITLLKALEILAENFNGHNDETVYLCAETILNGYFSYSQKDEFAQDYLIYFGFQKSNDPNFKPVLSTQKMNKLHQYIRDHNLWPAYVLEQINNLYRKNILEAPQPAREKLAVLDLNLELELMCSPTNKITLNAGTKSSL